MVPVFSYFYTLSWLKWHRIRCAVGHCGVGRLAQPAVRRRIASATSTQPGGGRLVGTRSPCSTAPVTRARSSSLVARHDTMTYSVATSIQAPGAPPGLVLLDMGFFLAPRIPNADKNVKPPNLAQVGSIRHRTLLRVSAIRIGLTDSAKLV
jgi:hypothetical protein